MAKVDEATLTPDAVASSRGRMVIVRTKRGTYVTRWPRKRPGGMTPGRYYHEQEFKLAAQWTSNPNDVDLRASMRMTDGTTNVPRDLRMMAIYGTLYEISRPEGGMAVRYRDVTTNAQLVLDQVTDDPGSLMYRSPSGWIGIPPGNDNQVLVIIDQVPQWIDLSPDTPQSGVHPLFGLLRPNVSATVAVNTVGGTMAMLDQGTIINGIGVYATAAAATVKVAPYIYTRNGAVPGTIVASGPQKTGLAVGPNLIPFSAPIVIPSTEFYFLAVWTTITTWSQAVHNTVIYGWNANAVTAPGNNPTVANSAFITTLPVVWVQ